MQVSEDLEERDIRPSSNTENDKVQKPSSRNHFSVSFVLALTLLGLGCIIAALVPLPLRLHSALFILVLLLVIPIYYFVPRSVNKRVKALVLVIIFTCLIVGFAQVHPRLILKEYQQILFDKLSANADKSKTAATTLRFP